MGGAGEGAISSSWHVVRLWEIFTAFCVKFSKPMVSSYMAIMACIWRLRR